MKSMKICAVSAPIAAYATYWFDLYSKNISKSSLVLQAAEGDMKLQQVQVIFRHGARTSISWSKERFQHFSNIKQHVWDKDIFDVDLPGTNIEYVVKLSNGSSPTTPMADQIRGAEMEGGCITGQLTCVGKKQLNDLGKLLAEEYIVNKEFISPLYQKGEIYVRSTYYQRTILSVVNLLSGLYGNAPLAEPICIETKENHRDDLYPNTKGCTNFSRWFSHVWSPEVITPEESEGEAYMNKLMGKDENIQNAFLSQINDLIRCRRAHGLSVPQFLIDNEALISKVELHGNLTVFGKGNRNILRIGIGSFLETLCCRVSEAIEGTSSHKMFLYSGHDWTIVPLLLAFDVDVDEWPPFASYIIIELYKRDDDKNFIRVVYNGKPVIFDSDCGQEFLPADKFLSLLEGYRVVDFDKACGNV